MIRKFIIAVKVKTLEIGFLKRLFSSSDKQYFQSLWRNLHLDTATKHRSRTGLHCDDVIVTSLYLVPKFPNRSWRFKKLVWSSFLATFSCPEVKVNFRNLTEQDVLCSIFWNINLKTLPTQIVNNSNDVIFWKKHFPTFYNIISPVHFSKRINFKPNKTTCTILRHILL